jgi:hypothetical protein
MRVLVFAFGLLIASPVVVQAQADTPVEYKLAVIQANSYVRPDAQGVKEIGWALDDLQDRCNESRLRLSDLAVVTRTQLAQRGVTASFLSILSDVNTPPGA